MAYEYPGELPIMSGNRKSSSHRDWLVDLADAIQDIQLVLNNLLEEAMGPSLKGPMALLPYKSLLKPSLI